MADDSSSMFDVLSKGANSLRDAAKWTIGALGAVAVVLLAGSQLSSIGSIDQGWRLLLAIGAVAIALGAIAFAMWKLFDLLRPSKTSLHTLATDTERAAALQTAYPELIEGIATSIED